MSNKTLGIVLIVVGVLFVVVAILAHTLGLSTSTTLGVKRILLLAVGAIALVAGVVMAFFMKPNKS